MPNSINAKKRHRQNLVCRDRNRSIKSRVRTSLRSLESVLKKEGKETAELAYRHFVKIIDSAVSKGVYHLNTASRKKSRMKKRVNALV